MTVLYKVMVDELRRHWKDGYFAGMRTVAMRDFFMGFVDVESGDRILIDYGDVDFMLRLCGVPEGKEDREYFQCEDCERSFFGDPDHVAGRDVCHGCRDQYMNCSGCDELHMEDDMYGVEDGRYCESCYEDMDTCECAECGNTISSDNAYSNGEDGDDDDGVLCSACYRTRQHRGQGRLAGTFVYHGTQNKQRVIPDGWSKTHGGRCLGFELEVQGKTDGDIVRFVKEMGHHFGAYVRGFEQDSSLNDGPGIEMVTQATGLTQLTELALSIPRVHGIRSHDTSTCGLHVHVSRDGLGIGTEMRLVNLFAAEAMEEFLLGMARRDWNSFCRRVEFDSVCSLMGSHIVGAWDHGRHNGKVLSRIGEDFDHHALDFSHDHTVEFRLFRGTTYGKSIAACLEFANAAVEYCALGGSVNIKDKKYTPEAFMEFVNSTLMSRDTKNLRDYITNNLPSNLAKARMSKPLPEFIGPVINKKVRRLACA